MRTESEAEEWPGIGQGIEGAAPRGRNSLYEATVVKAHGTLGGTLLVGVFVEQGAEENTRIWG